MARMTLYIKHLVVLKADYVFENREFPPLNKQLYGTLHKCIYIVSVDVTDV